jgi:hypothetical protein
MARNANFKDDKIISMYLHLTDGQKDDTFRVRFVLQ